MSNELFVELNDEQQELVSGGISLSEDVDSYFDLEQLATASVVTNGPGGSQSVTATKALDISSDISKYLDIDV
jgi:hypothetical protein